MLGPFTIKGDLQSVEKTLSPFDQQIPTLIFLFTNCTQQVLPENRYEKVVWEPVDDNIKVYWSYGKKKANIQFSLGNRFLIASAYERTDLQGEDADFEGVYYTTSQSPSKIKEQPPRGKYAAPADVTL